jgi:hypothetical protein
MVQSGKARPLFLTSFQHVAELLSLLRNVPYNTEPPSMVTTSPVM